MDDAVAYLLDGVPAIRWLIRSKPRDSGMWALELTHEGPIPFTMEREPEGFPSRWITLRALRVLRWAG